MWSHGKPPTSAAEEIVRREDLVPHPGMSECHLVLSRAQGADHPIHLVTILSIVGSDISVGSPTTPRSRNVFEIGSSKATQAGAVRPVVDISLPYVRSGHSSQPVSLVTKAREKPSCPSLLEG